jgi:protein tyrosine phosphatase (PTP) superfamily phosphohydrolase (DUF442 family)
MPVGEAADQLPQDRAEAAARHHGLAFRYQPVTAMSVTDEDVVDASQSCCTGCRGRFCSTAAPVRAARSLWAQAAVSRLGVDRTLEATAAAGYDLDPLREQLEERQKRAAAASLDSQPLRPGA